MTNTKHQHKYIPTLTIEILATTEKGYKVRQKDPNSFYRRERTDGIIQFYRKPELTELFIPL